MNMKLITAAVLCALVLVGCDESHPERSATAGKDFTVDTLFTYDGCTVYRFYDSGRLRYFTNCRGSAMSTHTESYRCGKQQCARTVHDDIPGGGNDGR